MKKRLLMFLGAFVIIYIFNFFVPRLMPGDPFQYTSSVSGEDMNVEMSAEQLAQLRAYYGLDKSLWTQFTDTLKSNLRGDFGQSIHYKRAVTDVLAERLPWTLAIMGITLALSLLAGTLLALVSVRRRGVDRIVYGALSAIGEIPSYLIGLLLLFFVAARVDWLPLSGGVTAFKRFDSVWAYLGDLAAHGFLPVLALCIVTIPGFYFTARASFLTVLSRPYMLQGKARGLTERRLRRAYILRNAVTPIVAKLFLSVGTVVGGTLLIENVFAYPGIGTVMREAVRYRDYILIQGVFLLSAVIVLVSMLIADLLNSRADKGVAQ